MYSIDYKQLHFSALEFSFISTLSYFDVWSDKDTVVRGYIELERVQVCMRMLMQMSGQILEVTRQKAKRATKGYNKKAKG